MGPNELCIMLMKYYGKKTLTMSVKEFLAMNYIYIMIYHYNIYSMRFEFKTFEYSALHLWQCR